MPRDELGVGAQFHVGGVGGFLGGRLVPAPIRNEDVAPGADVALIGEHD
jgi:hypothetical protein